MDAETLIRGYLDRLERAAAALPAGRRAELQSDVREHIQSALAEAGTRDELAVRNVLEQLGPPVEIVASELDEGGGVVTMAGRAQERSSLGAIEVIALLLLTVGAIVLPFVGPLLGLVFVWLSERWTRNEKLIATVIVVVLLVLPIALLFATSTESGFNAPALSSPMPMPYAP